MDVANARRLVPGRRYVRFCRRLRCSAACWLAGGAWAGGLVDSAHPSVSDHAAGRQRRVPGPESAETTRSHASMSVQGKGCGPAP